MKVCSYPECENLCEGRTDFCGTHNRIMRKTAKPVVFEKPIDGEYQKKVKRWKVGKVCALKDHSKCFGSITCHHQKGRIGDLLMDERYWLPVCLGHHRYIDTHPTEALTNGWSLLRLANEQHII